jgi:uncharacterized RDD family membrane protein YckC
MVMENAYYVMENGDKKGPFTFDEIIETDLDLHDKVFSPESDSWEDACDIPELFAYFEARGVVFPTEDNLATFGWRLLAHLIDFFLVSFVVAFVISILITNGVISNIKLTKDLTIDEHSYRQALIIQLIWYGVFVLYNSICESSQMKGSIGKKALKMVVVDADGLGITFLRSLWRSFGKVVSLFFYGLPFLSIFWTANKQALDDLMARTYVLKLQ